MSHLNIETVLTQAKDLIHDPSTWCRGHEGINGEGKDVLPWAEEAVAWCAMGAVRRVIWREYVITLFHTDNDRALTLFDATILALHNQADQCSQFVDDNGDNEVEDIVGVNDRLGHEAVLACYDAAIAAQQKAVTHG